MKAKVLTRINAVIAFLLGVLGFSGCEWGMKKYGVPADMYGTPYAMLEAKGTVTNEQNAPVKSARVTLRHRYSEDAYTDENGNYTIRTSEDFPVDSVRIVVSDTAGVYEADSVRLKVDYDRSDAKQRGDSWYRGTGYIYQDFQLKKK